jgi:Lipocalin-like domain
MRLLVSLVGLAISFALPAFSQQKTPKELIVGTWLLDSVYDQTQDGEKHNPWGDGVKGQAIFTSDGQFSWQMMSANRPKADTSPREPVGQVVAEWGPTRSTMRQRLIPSTSSVAHSRNGMGSRALLTLRFPQRTS